MKTMAVSILIVLGIQIPAFSQNRICGWETEKITSIKVDFTYQDHQQEIDIFDDRSDMDKILSFLKHVDFRTLNSSNRDSLVINNEKEYQISFSGQRDHIYLQTHSASIGKTRFLVNQNVIEDFRTLVHELNKNEDEPRNPLICP
ncbi:MAG: hypothetical protein MUC31_07665 [Bacteroidales bacterium]|jgi:hypothetical protein|nr:hypothetical protein [Bacteroidales bacterium]